jgi:hypothetical protein
MTTPIYDEGNGALFGVHLEIPRLMSPALATDQ